MQMQRLFFMVLVFGISGSLFAQVRHIQPVDPESRTHMALDLGLPPNKPINEAVLIQILRDTNNHRRGIAAQLLTTLPQTPESVQALQDAFADTRLIEDDSFRESLASSIIWSLAQIGETGWENSVVADLPKMTDRMAQLNVAETLVSVGRAEGWPIVKAAITDPKPFLVQSGLYHVEYFDQLPNPDGNKPIDVAAELRQLASTAPEQSRAQILEKADRVAQVRQER